MKVVNRALYVLGQLFLGDYDTVTAASGAATKNKSMVLATSEALTTAAGSEYTLTLTTDRVKAGDICMASVQDGTNTTAGAYVTSVTPANGSVVVKVKNGHASSALNGTIKIAVAIFNRLPS